HHMTGDGQRETAVSQAIHGQGRVALVSDGSRGIGAATVRRLAADGWDVGFSWRAVIDTSLDGVFHLCRTAVFAMMARRSGRIVTVSSVCGEYDHVPSGHDTLARPGVRGFTRALALQAGRVGIRLNAVTPGPGAPARHRAA